MDVSSPATTTAPTHNHVVRPRPPRLGRVVLATTILALVLNLVLPFGVVAAPTADSDLSAATATPTARTATPTPSAAAGTTRILVKFKPSASGADVANTIRAVGGTLIRSIPQIRTHVVAIPTSARDRLLAAYARSPLVERASASVAFKRAGTPNDPGYAQQWALPRIAWDQAYGTVAIPGTATIAVLDTGVDASRIWPG